MLYIIYYTYITSKRGLLFASFHEPMELKMQLLCTPALLADVKAGGEIKDIMTASSICFKLTHWSKGRRRKVLHFCSLPHLNWVIYIFFTQYRSCSIFLFIKINIKRPHFAAEWKRGVAAGFIQKSFFFYIYPASPPKPCTWRNWSIKKIHISVRS